MIRTGNAPALTARGAATRARIIQTATDLMRTQGVASTSIDAVLAESKTSKSQLYHYFADKDALVLAVIQRQAECVLAAQEELLHNLKSLANLRHWRDAVVQLSRQTNCAGGCPLGSLVPELAEKPRSRALLADGFRKWEDYLVAGFTAMRANGELKKGINPLDLATALLAALQGGLLLAQTMRSTRPLELALDMAIDQIAAKRPGG